MSRQEKNKKQSLKVKREMRSGEGERQTERKRERMLKLTFDEKQDWEKKRESQPGSERRRLNESTEGKRRRKKTLQLESKPEIERGKEGKRGVEGENPLLSTYQWFIISAGLSFLLVWWSCSPPSLSLSHMHTQFLTVDRSIWHPQGQRSSILGPKHNRACSAYPPPPPPLLLLLPLPAEKKQLLPPALEVCDEYRSPTKLLQRKQKLNELNHKVKRLKKAICDSAFRLELSIEPQYF